MDQDKDSVKVEDILKYVKSLELENENENYKLVKLITDLKKEERKKIESQLRIDELKETIEFYTTQAKNFSKRLNSGKKIYSQFELATHCAKRVIGLHDSKPQDFLIERRDMDNFEIIDFSKEIEQLYEKIQRNVVIINDLLYDLKICNEI